MPQVTISKIICGIENAENSQDHIIVSGKDLQFHIETLKKALGKISHGLKLNKSKSQIAVNEFFFWDI